MALLLKDCPDLVVKNNELARLVPWPCQGGLESAKGRLVWPISKSCLKFALCM